jgi:hypothetical protein
MTPQEFEIKQKELQDMEQMLILKQGLPHLFLFPHYPWSRKAFDSNNREVLLCSANQVGKSTTAIRKNIELATNPKLWPKFWPSLNGGCPNLFWYFYPSSDVATTEFETKWQQFMPQGDFKNHPQYGWDVKYDKGKIHQIVFNSGVRIQFKFHSQKPSNLQAATVYHVTCDEELPEHFLPEIRFRLNATRGYFMMVFTATLGQMYWKKAMEPSSKSEEVMPKALKIQVSMYDCLKYEDGTKGPWTRARITEAKDMCPTEAEVQRRVYGRFVKSSGLMFESFELDKNMYEDAPEDFREWSIYGGVDCGSGGQSGHPAGILFLAVSPDLTQGRVFRCWRGDNVATTVIDILDKYKQLRGKLKPIMQVYDYSSADFFSLATQDNEPFMRADKSRDIGIDLVNTLFKTGMLKILRNDVECGKLVQELTSLSVDTDKRKAKDDLIDPLRYVCMSVPWNIIVHPDEKADRRVPFKDMTPTELRRQWFMGEKTETDDIEDELQFWDDMHGG